jgi:Na+/H+ antiporter NhaC
MGLLNTIVVVLLILWIGGFLLHIAGAFIHVLLVIAIIVFLLRFIRKAA